MDQKKFAAGEILFSEGDAGDTAFLVAQGAVQVTREINGKETVLGEIGPGQILGEMALINNQPRMATAKAKEDTEVERPKVRWRSLGNLPKVQWRCPGIWPKMRHQSVSPYR